MALVICCVETTEVIRSFTSLRLAICGCFVLGIKKPETSTLPD
jgi:hypothetical protein